MKSEPKAPAASAIYLYRQIDRDDNEPYEAVYVRIKVLTEEGRKYGDVEIPYVKDRESIRSIQARTIRPDGTIVNFDGTVYEKELVKAQDMKLQTKTFTLPNVEVGSILEYRYRHYLRYGYVSDSRWILSDELFTRYAKFSLKPSMNFALRWSWPLGLPENTAEPKRDGRTIRLETRDVPAFVTEEYMPPADLLKYRVEFIYEENFSAQADEKKYWKAFGKRNHSKLQQFVSDRKALEQAVAQIVQPGDPAEVKARRIYAYMQKIRNLSFERQKSEQEEKRENIVDVKDAEDMLKRGYGDGVQVTWLFLGLARAAGLEADAVLVPTRDRYFFAARLMNAGQLNSNAVIVKLDGRDVFLDPGTPYTPFGMLPWAETAVISLRLDKDGGTWVTTPLPAPSASRVERKAALKLTTNGTVEGKVTVTYTGLEASWRRLSERNEDDTERKQFLEADLERDVPSGVNVKLINTPDWNAWDTPLVAEYDLKVPGWAAAAGKRALLPVALFSAGEKHTFEHGARVHPLYFSYPYQHVEDVTIELPPGWQVSSVPKPRNADLKVAVYNMTSEDSRSSLRLKRELTLNLTLVGTEHYGTIRNFFQTVRAGDEDQVVVTPGSASTLH